MCGIAGYLGTDMKVLAGVKTMTDIIAHRGPDGAGLLYVGKEHRLDPKGLSPVDGDFLAMGHRRLSIIDTTASGHQPMAFKGGRVWISYNGEIYNYIEVREELRAAGYAFSSESDTEVLLRAYEVWGTDCFRRFNGMWALAIWDGTRRKLILSRDRFGEKPLFYRIDRGSLLFASEIKAILAATPEVNFRPNLDVVLPYLKFGVVNHTDNTFFSGIRSVPAATYVEVDVDDTTKIDISSLQFKTYWSFGSDDVGLSEESAIQEFRRLFARSISMRMRSDVLVGACLSGGLDSSSIVSEAASQLSTASRFKVFNAGAVDARFDESRYAKLVAEHAGVALVGVQPTSNDFFSNLDKLIWHQEEPFTSASIFAQWELMRTAKENGVTVVLDGQGADEILCGYKKFYFFLFKELLTDGQWWSAVRELVGALLYGDRGLLGLLNAHRYLPRFLQKPNASLESILLPQYVKKWKSCRLGLSKGRSLRERQEADLREWSLPSLLRYEDRNSMAWAIEARVPFLDHELTEFSLGLPAQMKIRCGRNKVILRKSMKKMLPREISERRDKMGFVTPQVEWLRTDELGAFADELENPHAAVSELMDVVALRRKYDLWKKDPSQGGGDILFRVFLLSRWAKVYLKHRPTYFE